jgi:hypothetical protein
MAIARAAERWEWAAKVAAGFAFFQAGVTAIMIAVAAANGKLLAGQDGFRLFSALDVFPLCGLAVSLLNGHVWAAYALVVYGSVDRLLNLLNFGLTVWILPTIAYIGGAVVLLSSSSALSPQIAVVGRRAALGWAAFWFAGDFALAFTFGLVGLTEGGVAIAPSIGLAQNSLYIVWGIGLSYVVARHSAWPIEAILLEAVVSVALFSGFTSAQFVNSAPGWLAAGFIGLGIAQLLSHAGVREGDRHGQIR